MADNTNLERCIQAMQGIMLARSTYASSTAGFEIIEKMIASLEIVREPTHPHGSLCQSVARALREHYFDHQWPNASTSD